MTARPMELIAQSDTLRVIESSQPEHDYDSLFWYLVFYYRFFTVLKKNVDIYRHVQKLIIPRGVWCPSRCLLYNIYMLYPRLYYYKLVLVEGKKISSGDNVQGGPLFF